MSLNKMKILLLFAATVAKPLLALCLQKQAIIF